MKVDQAQPPSNSIARRMLNFIVAAAVIVLSVLAVLRFSKEIKIAAVLIAAAAGVILFCLPQTFAFSLLLFSSYFEKTRWEVGFTLKLEHIFIIFVIFLLFLRPSGKRWKHIPATHYPVAAYLAANAFSTALFSLEPDYAFRQLVLITIVTLSYFVVSAFCLRHAGQMKKLFHLYLAMGVLHSVYGIVSFMLLRAGIRTGGAYLTGQGSYYVCGGMHEGNLFGGLTAMHTLMLFNMAQDRSLPAAVRRWLWPAMSIHAIALIMSNTRTAVAGFLIGLIISIWMARREQIVERLRLYRRAISVICAGVVIFAAVVWASGIVSPTEYVSRFTNLLDPEHKPQTLTGRLISYKRSLGYWQRNPLFGHGTGSYKSFQRAKMAYEKSWVGNQFVLSLQDTGIVGAAILLWLLGATFIPYFGMLKRRRDEPDRCYLIGFFTSLVAIWICFQMTTGTWMAYFWVWFGFAAAFLEAARGTSGQ
ncbi:MAG: O-antigen ligase family protein [bacterium]